MALWDAGLAIRVPRYWEQRRACNMVGAIVCCCIVPKLFSIDRRFRHAQPALPPDDARQLLDQMLLGRAHR